MIEIADNFGAGRESRTLVSSLEGYIIAVIRYPHKIGATLGIRTPDPRFTKAML
jgi:hypothetical protein